MNQTKLRKQKNGGITLIALVITIIVLLILAGITINLTIGQDGILKRVEEAGKNYTQAAEKEKTELAQFSNLTDKIIDNVTKNHYTMVDGVPVPKGFSPITTDDQGTKETGFVIKNDTDGNEFVWVPVDSSTPYKYERVAFSRNGWTTTQTLNKETGEITRADDPEYAYTEMVPSYEVTSVKTYGGFYIGRYESGVSGYDLNVEDSNDSDLSEWTGYNNGKLVVKSNQQVWNYVTRDKAKIISEELYKKSNGESVNSKLCSSYAWDTALKFIDTKNPGYSTDSTVGNYLDKSDALGKPAKTGLTRAVNNIYDMGGNVSEWTTEECSKENYPCTRRGGFYSNNSSDDPAAYRRYSTRAGASDYLSFRIALYL